MVQYTRCGTVILGFLQAIGMSLYLRSALENLTFFLCGYCHHIDSRVAFLWMGRLITEKFETAYL